MSSAFQLQMLFANFSQQLGGLGVTNAMELGQGGVALGWPLSHFGVSLDLWGVPKGRARAVLVLRSLLPPQLMGLSHVLVRKSSPNLPVKGVHCQQVDTVSLCVALSHLL